MEKRISGTTTLLALIGSPVGHSGSPAMHNYSFEKLGLDYAYMAFEIKEDQVGEFLDAARLLKIRGFNVTMPCKMEVARQVDELAPAAQIMGASNTVVNENGKLIPENIIKKDKRIYEYLLKQKEELGKRSCDNKNGESWYAYGRTQALNDTYKDKIGINTLIKKDNGIKIEDVPAGTGIYSGLYIQWSP